jgi:hypothetical protein
MFEEKVVKKQLCDCKRVHEKIFLRIFLKDWKDAYLNFCIEYITLEIRKKGYFCQA